MAIVHVASVSSGKDSDAALLKAIKRFGKHRVIAVFCDTGNEHIEAHRHIDYLEETLGIRIVRLKASFDEQIASKRMFIARDRRHRRQYDLAPMFDENGNPIWKREPGTGNVVHKEVKRGGVMVSEPVQRMKKVGGGRRVRWTNKAKRRALAFLKPTGNPYLDLCLWKGRFPSRNAQFCTEELKRNPLVEFQLDLIDQGYTVVNWQGVRRDESAARRNAKTIERVGPKLFIYRPIADWTAEQTFAYAKSMGVQPNKLYLMGMLRVGCMPCINAGKFELRAINERCHEHLERIEEWEYYVRQCSKLGYATFFPSPGVASWKARDNGIWTVVEWAKTERGGRFTDTRPSLFAPTECSSAYGLCE